MEEKKLQAIMEILSKKYPQPTTALNFTTPFELLIATILSAQSTDQQVNKVTAKLFKKYRTAEDFAQLEREELAREINSIGLYRNKSRFIIETSRQLLEKYGGEVPRKRSELMKLPGVGRKTANVVLACAFLQPAFPVDTHVFRVARRIGLSSADKVEGVEKDLMELIPEDKWIDMHHWLIFHGRETCKAQNPNCLNCLLQDYCYDYQRREG